MNKYLIIVGKELISSYIAEEKEKFNTLLDENKGDIFSFVQGVDSLDELNEQIDGYNIITVLKEKEFKKFEQITGLQIIFTDK